jgi:hypothetical protein
MSFSHFSPAVTNSLRIVSRCRPLMRSAERTEQSSMRSWRTFSTFSSGIRGTGDAILRLGAEGLLALDAAKPLATVSVGSEPLRFVFAGGARHTPYDNKWLLLSTHFFRECQQFVSDIRVFDGVPDPTGGLNSSPVSLRYGHARVGRSRPSNRR